MDKLMAAKGASFDKEVAYRASQAAGIAVAYIMDFVALKCL
jgi:hypothetical protein